MICINTRSTCSDFTCDLTKPGCAMFTGFVCCHFQGCDLDNFRLNHQTDNSNQCVCCTYCSYLLTGYAMTESRVPLQMTVWRFTPHCQLLALVITDHGDGGWRATCWHMGQAGTHKSGSFYFIIMHIHLFLSVRKPAGHMQSEHCSVLFLCLISSF